MKKELPRCNGRKDFQGCYYTDENGMCRWGGKCEYSKHRDVEPPMAESSESEQTSFGKIKSASINDVQRWIDSKPKMKSRHIGYAIKMMIDELAIDDVREVTNYALNVEREQRHYSRARRK